MAGRHSHLQADSAEAGLEQYLATCGASGLESVQRKARSYRAMPQAKRLARYMNEFEAAANWGEADAPEQRDDVVALQNQLADIQAQLEAIQGGGNSVAKTAERVEAASFVKGTTFSYRNGNGDTSRHTIERVAGGRAFTDTNKRFKISTLEMLVGSGVVEII